MSVTLATIRCVQGKGSDVEDHRRKRAKMKDMRIQQYGSVFSGMTMELCPTTRMMMQRNECEVNRGRMGKRE